VSALRVVLNIHATLEMGGSEGEAFPFLSAAPLTATYVVWAAVWVAMIWGLTAAPFLRKGL